MNKLDTPETTQNIPEGAIPVGAPVEQKPDGLTHKIESSANDAVAANSDAIQKHHIPAALIAQLLPNLRVSIEKGALIKACEKIKKDCVLIPPSQQINAVFHELKIKGVQVAQLRWTRFDQRKLPALLFMNTQWYLVERGEGSNITLTTPSGECRKTDELALESAIVIWLREPPKRSAFSVFAPEKNIAASLVFSEMFKSRRWLFDITIATLIINLLAISTSLFAMQVYDRVVPTLAYATLTTLVMGMVIVIFLDWLLKTVRARTLDSVSCAVNNAVSQQVFDHVMHLQLDKRPQSLGTLAAQVAGLDSVRAFFTSGVIFALVDMPFALMFIAFIGIIGGPIGWVYLFLLPIAATLGWVTQKRLRRLMKEEMIRSNERQGLLVDAIQGTESIRASQATWRFSEKWQEVTHSISRYSIQEKAINSFATVTTGSLSTIAYVSAIIVGVGQIEAGNLTMGALIACSILGGRVIAPVSQCVHHLMGWQNVSQSLQMVNQVLVLDTERTQEKTLLTPDETPDKIVLDGVKFSYEASPVQQLNIPHLCLQSGERILLMGANGAGKSTLLKTLAGLYRPSEGRVRLGNADLWEIDPSVVGEYIGYLPQQVHLFKGTLRTNLTLSGLVSDSRLLKISEQLGIDKIAADNPKSMDLDISEGGEGLSGGQRQLVGLGRVFLARPKIWLLDEPTASLDIDSDAKVLQAIADNVKPQDILVISTHRIALASKIANRALFMQQGEILMDDKPENVISTMMRRQTTGNNSKSNNRLTDSNRGPQGGPGYVI